LSHPPNQALVLFCGTASQAAFNSTVSINVTSSASAFELLTCFVEDRTFV
jgi:hypothetical protein